MVKQESKAVFVVEPEGWREQNAGRPAEQLVREAVQNCLDEACTRIIVLVKYDPERRGVYYKIVDDVPGGIRDERLIWTIWMSDKVDSPNKRGRMGRGLKELIAVSDESLIVTAGGPAVEFKRTRGKWERTSPRKVRPAAGTVVEGFTKLWGKKDADAIVDYLMRIIPPAGIELLVNGMPCARARVAEAYILKLPTIVFELLEDGSRVAREPRRETSVELFDEPVSWVYEMGIPVEKIDFPLSINIGQRVPLREKRDTLTDPYRRELFAKLLDARNLAGKVSADSLRDNHAIIATQAPEHLSPETKKRVADAWTNGMAYASTPQVMQQATGQHLPAVLLRKLPEGVRDIVKEVGTDAKQVLAERALAATSLIAPSAYTPEQSCLVTLWEWISRGINRSCSVRLCLGRPSAAASFSREGRVLTVYVENIPECVKNPIGVTSLSTLIHELAHWREQDNEHGMGFHSDAEIVGAELAQFLLLHAEETKSVMREGFERGL